MPSDSCNLTMVKAMGLIFLLFDIASVREVPFAMPLYIQCILHGLSRALPFIFAHQEGVDFVVGFNSSSVIFIDLRFSTLQ